MRKNYHYSPEACVFKKSYGDIFLTIVLELPRNLKKDPRKETITLLKDELYNLMNDSEIERLLAPKVK